MAEKFANKKNNTYNCNMKSNTFKNISIGILAIALAGYIGVLTYNKYQENSRVGETYNELMLQLEKIKSHQ